MMPWFGRKRPRWPPSPSVEDEMESLARELHGLSKIGEMPGLEGVQARGTMDQLSVLEDAPLSEFSFANRNSWEEFGCGNSPSDGNSEPITPPVDMVQDPMIYTAGDVQGLSSKSPSLCTPLPTKDTPPRKQSSSQVGPQPRKPQTTTGSRERSVSRHPVSGSKGASAQRNSPPARSSQFSTQTPRNTHPLSSRGRASEGVQPKVTSSVPVRTRSESVRHERPMKRTATGAQQLVSTSGYQSDSAALNPKDTHDHLNKKLPLRTGDKASNEPPNTPSVAERLEEKLRRRKEIREAGHNPQEDGQIERRATEPSGTSLSTTHSLISASQSPSRGPRSRASSRSARPMPADTTLEDQSLVSFSTTAPAPLATRQAGLYMDKGLQRSKSSSRKTQQEEPQGKLQVFRQDRSPEPVRQSSPGGPSVCLLPCPRSVSMAGYQDWYTIKGLDHLDICPSCVKQMRKSRFHESFIPGIPKPRDQKIRCSFSEPWIRLAWVQTIKKHYDNLDMLYQITRPPPGSKICSGRIITDQNWYRIIDDDGMYMPNFNVCQACIWKLRTLMPLHRDTFKKSTKMQDGVCDFVIDSPRFVRYIDLLDIAANRAEYEHSTRPDVSEFIAYTQRKVVLRDCRRDRLLLSTWHYMPELPELTVCEDCYDDVVWPLVKADKPIARKFCKSMRLLPGDGLSRCREASCQLYSPRIRAKFHDAVQRNDLTYLKLIALRRYDAEQHFRERWDELREDESRGYDCDTELRKTLREWRRWE